MTRKDVLGRIVAVEEPYIQGMRGDTAYTHNTLDKLASVTQSDGVNPAQVRSFAYDAFGFLRSETHPEKGTSTYSSYDALGNLLSKSEGGVTSTFAYDLAGRLTRQIAAGVSYVTNCFDGGPCIDGNPGFSGGTYKLGRLTRRYGFNPRSPRQPSVTEDFTYNLAIGPGLSKKATSLTNAPRAIPAINETWSYNTLGLVDVHGLPYAGTNPNVSGSLQYTSGLPTRLVSGSQTLVASALYNPSGGLSSWTAGNGVSTTIDQDWWLMPRPRRISTSVPVAQGGLDTGDFSYDGAGNITVMGSNFFTYDARSRLKTGLGQSFDYDRWGNLNPAAVDPLTNRIKAGGYDTRGNLLRQTGQTYRYDELSRQITFEAGKERYLHDGAGERIARVTSTSAGLGFEPITPCRIRDTRDAPATPLGSSGPVTVQVTGGPCGIPADAEAFAGNLTAVGPTEAGFILAQPAGTSGLDASTVNFAAGQIRGNNFSLGLSTGGQIDLMAAGPTSVHAIVDAFGYYVYAGTAAQETWNLTLRDEGNRLSSDYTVTSSATTRKRNYFYFGNLLVATREDNPSSWRYYASDHLGTPRVVTNSSGGVVESHSYRPFGEEIGGTFGAQPLKFAAMERDASSGNDYNHARYQSPLLGRFLSPDKLQGRIDEPQSWNRYSYALNNPLKYVDPDGLAPEETSRSFFAELFQTLLEKAFPARPAAPDPTLAEALREADVDPNVGTKALGGTGLQQSLRTGLLEGTSDIGGRLVETTRAGFVAGMLGEFGAQFTSKTLYNRGGVRLDVENPSPGRRAGQVHVQHAGRRFLLDPRTGRFKDAPAAINRLVRTDPRFRAALVRGLRKYLGEKKLPPTF